jgi:hypothetical protein
LSLRLIRKICRVLQVFLNLNLTILNLNLNLNLAISRMGIAGFFSKTLLKFFVFFIKTRKNTGYVPGSLAENTIKRSNSIESRLKNGIISRRGNEGACPLVILGQAPGREETIGGILWIIKSNMVRFLLLSG